jgi:hypothetical protein
MKRYEVEHKELLCMLAGAFTAGCEVGPRASFIDEKKLELISFEVALGIIKKMPKKEPERK